MERVRDRGARARVLLALLLALATVSACAPSELASEAGGEVSVGSVASPPRGIILVIGDGMGYEHLAALDAIDPQVAVLLDTFPVDIAVRTGSLGSEGVPVDPAVAQAVTDSAAAATAMAVGVKTLNGYLGVDSDGDVMETLVEAAEGRGMATGLVTSVQFSHATPAAFAAHSVDRADYTGIARQMLLESGLDVLLGAGHPDFDDDGVALEAPGDIAYVGGQEVWDSVVAGQAGGDADDDGMADPWTLVDTEEGLQAYSSGRAAGRLLFVAPVARTLQAERSGPRTGPFETTQTPGVPGLDVMTEAALRILQTDPEGFFLVVEGGAIDWASHENESGRTIEELDALADTIRAIAGWVDAESTWEDSLLVVTADHETGGLITGTADEDGVSTLTWSTQAHTGALVPLLARGRGAARFAQLADEADPERGEYLQNTEIHEALLAAFPQ